MLVDQVPSGQLAVPAGDGEDVVRPVLVLLNGIPASGKSTLARRWVEGAQSGLGLALDIDLLRGMLGSWRRTPGEAGLAARAMALAAVSVHLGNGHDVIVPQYLPRSDFIDQLASSAETSNAAFVECVLLVDHEVASDRFLSRAATAAAQGRAVDEGELAEPMRSIRLAFERSLAGRSGLALLDPEGPDLLEQLSRAVSDARQR